MRVLEEVVQCPGSLYLLTSGTTSDQASGFKWVVLSKSGFLKSAQSVNEALGQTPETGDTWLHFLPDFHVGGLAIRARSHLSGARLVELSSWSVSDFIAAILKYQVTLISLVPAQIFDLCQRDIRCPESVRTVLVGAGALAPEVFLRARELGWPVRMTYAMTEASSTVALTPLDSSAFQVLPHWEVRTEGDETDLLWIKGEGLLSFYILSDLNDHPGKRGGAFRRVDPKVDGWFKTSDRVMLTGRSLQLLGRSGDLIKIGGEKVEMARLHQILEGIRAQFAIHFKGPMPDMTLLPVPDDRLGNVIHLMSDESLTAELFAQIESEFASQVLPFEKIRKWHRVDQIPRTTLGKVLIQSCLAKRGDL